MTISAPLPDSSESRATLCELIARIASGNQDALTTLYSWTGAQVYGFVLRILRDRGVAEEVTVDVYAQVWRRAGGYDAARSKPFPWLMMLARSRALDSLRSRRNERLTQSLSMAGALVDASPSPEDHLESNGQQRRVRLAVDSLVPEQRDAIELAFYAGMSHTAIAEKLRQPIGTVKSRIRLGMQHLRERLQENGEI